MPFFITLEHDNSICVVTGLIDFERLILVTISCHMLKELLGANEHKKITCVQLALIRALDLLIDTTIELLE